MTDVQTRLNSNKITDLYYKTFDFIVIDSRPTFSCTLQVCRVVQNWRIRQVSKKHWDQPRQYI